MRFQLGQSDIGSTSRKSDKLGLSWKPFSGVQFRLLLPWVIAIGLPFPSKGFLGVVALSSLSGLGVRVLPVSGSAWSWRISVLQEVLPACGGPHWISGVTSGW